MGNERATSATTGLADASPVRDGRRIVVKVGSTLVTNEGRGLDGGAISQWGRQIAELRALGKEVVMVSSGAVAEGMKRLGWAKRPKAMHELQAAEIGRASCRERVWIGGGGGEGKKRRNSARVPT